MASVSITVRDYHTEIPGELSTDGMAWLFPLITSVNSHGKQTEWRIHVKAARIVNGKLEQPYSFHPIVKTFFDNKKLDNIAGYIKVESRVVGGKIRDSVPTIVATGKNLKSKSATNAFCQALRDAYSLYNKQLKKANVGANVGTPNELNAAAPNELNAAAPNDLNVAAPNVEIIKSQMPPPMLAQVVKKDKLKYPVHVQPKFNGVRSVLGLINGRVIMYSRGGNIYPGLEYIKKDMEPVLRANPGVYFDGEIYKHGVPLQDISGEARKEGSTARFDYMIYDCFTIGDVRTYPARKEFLNGVFNGIVSEYVKPVETLIANDWRDIEVAYEEFTKHGYEGAMIRLNHKYVHSYNAHHSKYLLKLKPTFDAEFIIEGWTVGTKGKATGAFMVVCKTDSGAIFPVTPAMEISERILLTQKLKADPKYFDEHYKGKPLIVYFAERSKDGLPQQPRTKMEIRTWE